MMISGEVTLSQEQAFLADICAHSDDDAPRLIFADWLTERDRPGDAERAELIRVQCALALTWYTQDGVTCPACALDVREREVLPLVQDRLRQEWRSWADAAGRPVPWWYTWTFRRGFVEHITLSAGAWCRYAERLLATQPLREVTLTTRLDIWLCAHPERPGFAYLYPCQGDSSPLWTVPLVDWIGAKYNPAGEGESRGQVQVLRARWLWPGVLFHGPDFPEGKS
jgi:uncharacterized protein (TIGR02996 family)